MEQTAFADYFGDIDFWMLNGKLSADEIKRQMLAMKERNIRCFIARTYIGLESDYPGKDFKRMLRCIIENAAELDMNLFLQAAYMPNAIPADGGYICGKYLVYENGQVRIENSPTFLDVFSFEAVQRYLDHAYGEVWQEFSPYFGNVIRSIWVDEPSFPRMKVPWSEFLRQAFQKMWNYDPQEHLSKLFTDEEGAETFRCHFYAAVTRQLESAYFKPLQKWCNDHNLLASGHLLMEDSMWQTLCCGGAMMPFYKYFDIPGIDVLTGENKFVRYPLTRQFSSPDVYGMMYLTPLQCVSAANQAGKKHVLCEMYGVTTENFGLREQKNMFDYFSAFGITRRSVHGLFYSLRGRRKRTYPPHVFDYQPYWSEYGKLTAECLETSDFIARSTAVRDMLVLHPLWSAAAMYNYSCGRERLQEYDQKFLQLLIDMMHSHYRFDLGDEETVADSGKVNDDVFTVGKMDYQYVLLPYLHVISQAVLDLLEKFAAGGGKIWVLGALPELLDGYPAKEKIAAALASAQIFESLEDLPEIPKDYTLKTDDASALLINQRQCGDEKLFFIFNTDYQNPHHIDLQVEGMELFVQQSGKLCPLNRENSEVPEGGSLRIVARPGKMVPAEAKSNICCHKLELSEIWQLESRSNPNVLLLEFASYRLENCSEWSKLYPILAIQQILTEQNYRGRVELKYDIVCGDDFKNIALALEDAAAFDIMLNGKVVENKADGFYLARDFQKIQLGDLHRGGNELVIAREFAPLTKPTNAMASLYEKLSGCELENCYLLGDFAVKTTPEFTLTNALRFNRRCVLVPEEKFVHGNLSCCGYSFYAGKVRLTQEFVLPENAPTQALLKLPCPDAAAVAVELNGSKQGVLAWHPYELKLDGLKAGKNILTLELSGTLRNIIGPFHRPQGEYGSCFDGYSCPNLNWVGIRETDGTEIPEWYNRRDVATTAWVESYLQVRFGISNKASLEFE